MKNISPLILLIIIGFVVGFVGWSLNLMGDPINTLDSSVVAQYGPESSTVILRNGEVWEYHDQRGNVNVAIQDQFSPSIDLLFMHIRGLSTLSADCVRDEYTISCTSLPAGTVVGDCIQLKDSDFDIPNLHRIGTYRISAIDGTTLTITEMLDYAYKAESTEFVIGSPNLNVDGSSTPQIFIIGDPGWTVPAPQQTDITQINFQMTTTDPPEFSEFGDIAGGLDRGIYARYVDTEYRNLWCAQTNADLALICAATEIYSSTLPIGVNGLAAQYKISGQDNHGVTVRLQEGDSLQLIVQDDLTDLLSFRVVVQGHVVE